MVFKKNKIRQSSTFKNFNKYYSCWKMKMIFQKNWCKSNGLYRITKHANIFNDHDR